jgi:hypothetical protein
VTKRGPLAERLIDEAASVLEAQDGDYRRLEWRLRRDAELSRAERNFLADLLAGKITHPANRPKSKQKALRREIVAKFILVHPGPLKVAVAAAMKRYGISKTEVYEARKRSTRAVDGVLVAVAADQSE